MPETFFQFAPHIHPAVGFVLAALGVIILGIAKSGFGGGVGIVAVPLFAIAFGAQRGTAILLPLLIAADIFSVLHHWGKWDRRILRLLAPGTLAGIALGSLVLWYIVAAPATLKPAPTSPTLTRESSADALNLITGIVSVLYVLLDQIRLRLAPKWYFKPNTASGFAAGAAIGIISTLAHAAGPVAAIFLLNQGLTRAAFMGTTVIYFFGINTVKLIPYTLIPNLTNGSTVLVGLCFVPFAPLGTFLGKFLCDRMSEKLFRNAILIITLVTGIQLVLEYATGIKLTALIAHTATPATQP